MSIFNNSIGLIAAVCVAGCTGQVDDEPRATYKIYRNPATNVSSHVSHMTTDLSGKWHAAERLPAGFESVCEQVEVQFVHGGGGQGSLLHQCQIGDGWRSSQFELQFVGNGRYKVAENTGTGIADLWVLWSDVSNTTLILADPHGQLAWILHRSPRIPQDRLRAARDILEFNGYSTADR